MRRHFMTFKGDSTAAGEQDPTFDTTILANVPCDFRAKGGNEIHRGRQLQAETTHIIETRYYSELKAKENAIVENDETSDQYHILRISDLDGRKRFLLIEATEVTV